MMVRYRFEQFVDAWDAAAIPGDQACDSLLQATSLIQWAPFTEFRQPRWDARARIREAMQLSEVLICEVTRWMRALW
jgi:hypothetical protein